MQRVSQVDGIIALTLGVDYSTLTTTPAQLDGNTQSMIQPLISAPVYLEVGKDQQIITG